MRAVFSLEHHIMLLSFSSRRMPPRLSLPSKHFIVDFLFADAHAGPNKWCPTSAAANGELGNPGLFVSQQRLDFLIITNKHAFERVSTNVDSKLVISQYYALPSREINSRFNSYKQYQFIASNCSVCDIQSAIIHVCLSATAFIAPKRLASPCEVPPKSQSVQY